MSTAVLVGMCALGGTVAGAVINRTSDQVWASLNSSATDGTDTTAAPLRLDRCRSLVRRRVVELVSVVLFAAAGVRFGYHWALPLALVLVAGLLTLAVTDLENYLLPVRILYPVLGALVGLQAAAAVAGGDWHRVITAWVCGLCAFAAFFAFNMSAPEALAFGDVRLAGVIGIGLGWTGVRYALLGFLVAVLLATATGVGVIATRRERGRAKPFGLFLAIGAGTAIYAGRWLLPFLRA